MSPPLMHSAFLFFFFRYTYILSIFVMKYIRTCSYLRERGGGDKRRNYRNKKSGVAGLPTHMKSKFASWLPRRWACQLVQLRLSLIGVWWKVTLSISISTFSFFLAQLQISRMHFTLITYTFAYLIVFYLRLIAINFVSQLHPSIFELHFSFLRPSCISLPSRALARDFYSTPRYPPVAPSFLPSFSRSPRSLLFPRLIFRAVAFCALPCAARSSTFWSHRSHSRVASLRAATFRRILRAFDFFLLLVAA